MGSYKWIAVL